MSTLWDVTLIKQSISLYIYPLWLKHLESLSNSKVQCGITSLATSLKFFFY